MDREFIELMVAFEDTISDLIAVVATVRRDELDERLRVLRVKVQDAEAGRGTEAAIASLPVLRTKLRLYARGLARQDGEVRP